MNDQNCDGEYNAAFYAGRDVREGQASTDEQLGCASYRDEEEKEKGKKIDQHYRWTFQPGSGPCATTTIQPGSGRCATTTSSSAAPSSHIASAKMQARQWKLLRAMVRAKSRPAAKPSWLIRNKESLAALQSLLTVVALLMAFLWFQGQHQTIPKLKIDQAFAQRPYLGIDRSEGEILLSVQVWLTNVGTVSDYLEPGKIRIDEVNPESGRIYCDMITDIDVSVDCDKFASQQRSGQNPTIVNSASAFVESLRRSTALGWFWRPKSPSRWIEANEKDQAFAKVYRLAGTTRTVRISSIWSAGNGGFWKAVDFVDLERSNQATTPAQSGSAANPKIPPSPETRRD